MNIEFCRLCLKVVTKEFEKIDEVIRQMFNILSLKLDLNLTRDPIICRDCVEVAKKCLKFKLTCFTTERIICSFSTGWENAKYNMKAIYKEREDVEIAIHEDLDICRICITLTDRRNIACLDTLTNEATLFKIISEFLPEMDFNIIKNPMICTRCRENLEGYFKFVVKCSDMEDKIKSCCKKEVNESTDQVKSGNSRHSSFKDILEHNLIYPQIGVVKEDSNMFGDTKCGCPDAHNGFLKFEELDIKGEIDLENNFPSKEFGKESKSDADIYEYTYASKKKGQSVLIHQIDKVASQCKQEKYKMYKCPLCAYEGKNKSYLRKHMVVHKDISEIKMHKCLFCAYEARQKANLKTHMLVHKDTSEIKMYKCPLCAYETKRKNDLKIHMLVHKDVSEIKMHKCPLCVYEAKQKTYLQKHMLVHKDVSKITMHKCPLCAYEAKQKANLETHMLVHKDVSELKMYKCLLCAYETKRKNDLKTHMLVHDDVCEIKMHKCSLCTYETKRKHYLKGHMLEHKC